MYERELASLMCDLERPYVAGIEYDFRLHAIIRNMKK